MSNDLTTSTKAKCSQASEALRVPPEKYFIDFWSLARTTERRTQNTEHRTGNIEELAAETEYWMNRMLDWVRQQLWANAESGPDQSK